jgi:hypothetical protein
LLLMLPWSFPALWRKARPESLTVLVIVACSLLLASRFILWHGLWSSPSPRMLFVATPLFMLAIGPWLDSKPSRRGLTAAGLLGILGAAVQLPLMAVNWREVVTTMGYPPYAPKMEFLFDPQMSPILGCTQGLLAGNIDVWLWSLWAGARGREPELFAAMAFTLLWAGVFALALASLTRALRTHPEA